MNALIRFLLASVLALIAAQQTLQGAGTILRTVGGVTNVATDNVKIQRVATEEDGAVYVTGTYVDSAYFARGVTVTNVNQPRNYHAFLAKQDASGRWLWAKTIYGPSSTNATSTVTRMAVNAIHVTADSVYVGGSNNHGDGVRQTGFITRMDKEGNVLWTRLIIGATASVNAFTTDPSGSLYVASDASTSTRQPNIGVSMLNNPGSAPVTFLLQNERNALLTKLEPSGAYIWTARCGNTSSMDSMVAVVADASRVHVVMNMNGSTSGEPAELVNANSSTVGGTVTTVYGTAPVVASISFEGVWNASSIYALSINADLRGLSPATANFTPFITSLMEATDMKLIGGKLYLSGRFSSTISESKVSLLAAETRADFLRIVRAGINQGGFLIKLRTDDHRSDGPVAYFRSAQESTLYTYSPLSALTAHPTRISGDTSGIYVTGIMPETLQILTTSSGSSVPSTVNKDLTATTTSRFIGKFDTSLNPVWLRTTERTATYPPPGRFESDALAMDPARQRLVWGGAFATTSLQALALGDEPNVQVATTPASPSAEFWGWITGLNTDGTYLSQATLRIESTYGPIQINGVPTAVPAEVTVYRGTPVTLNAESSESDSIRRILTGYSVNNVPSASTGSEAKITVVEDVTVEFLWRTQYRLLISSDHSALGIPAAASVGDPEPLFGVHWIDAGTMVHATVDGIDASQNQAQEGTRLALSGYNTSALGQAPTPSTALPSPEDRRVQIDVLMDRPRAIFYNWKRQYQIASTHSTDSLRNLLMARVLNANNAEVAGSLVRYKSGDVWFNENDRVEIGALMSDDVLSLKGWHFASPVDTGYFPVDSFAAADPIKTDAEILDSVLGSRTVGTETYNRYRTLIIPQLKKPIRVYWNYGERLIRFNLPVGNSLELTGDAASAVLEKWTGGSVLSGPNGSAVDDMFVWDQISKRAIAARPGITTLEWRKAGGGKLITQVFTGFRGDTLQVNGNLVYGGPAYYPHIASTPPVDLDPSDTDGRYFQQLLYTEGDGTVVGKQFTAGETGRSVLLFYTKSSGVATGNPLTESAQVRVVNTAQWNANVPVLASNAQTVRLAEPLPSRFDLAGLGTGYVVHRVSNYNPDIYDRQNLKGPIIPVNTQGGNPEPTDKDLVVVWYDRFDGIVWPYIPVFYRNFIWSPGSQIVVASRLGSEGQDLFGAPQTVFDPESYSDVKIYNQPDRTKPGYNPNEEHARIYPSLYHSLQGKQIPAAFALRDDLNISLLLTQNSGRGLTQADFTSEPIVLVQYFHKTLGQHRMKYYEVRRENFGNQDPRLLELPGSASSTYNFHYTVTAGEPIVAPYPLNLVMGLVPCINTVPNLYQTPTALPNGSYFSNINPGQLTWFVDHKRNAWAVSGDSGVRGFYYYPLQSDFWYPPASLVPSNTTTSTGDCVPFLPSFVISSITSDNRFSIFDPSAQVRAEPQGVLYDTVWPQNPPVLKVGETLTYAGGENKADNPDAPGLPAVLGFASGQIVFDSANPQLVSGGLISSYMARLIAPLEERVISYPTATLPPNLNSPASPDVTVEGDTWYFNKLPASLQRRVFFKPLAKLNATDAPGVLGVRGYVNDRTLGASDLTASPPPLYVLEPNILTLSEKQSLVEAGKSEPIWANKILSLYELTRNPSQLTGLTGYLAGLEPSPAGTSVPQPLVGLGPGLALVTNPSLLSSLNTLATGYVTLAENNHPSLGDAPVSLHVIKVDATQRYRGAIKTLLAPNVFDESMTLQHTADFGGNVDHVFFAWWSHEEDGTVKTGHVPGGSNGNSPPWAAFGTAEGVLGQSHIELKGSPSLLLADNRFFVHYRYEDQPVADASWSGWAGAANSSIRDLDSDGKPDYRGQLASGWVKRVLDAINPYEARIRNFNTVGSPATVASLIQNLGGPFVGEVALNANKDVVENVGLIELYETVLARARKLSIDASQPTATPGVNAAILLASTRLAEFYTLLGHEAWDDALDPTIGFGNSTTDIGNLNASRFCFENLFPSLLDEELALLRGVDESFGRPVYNRILWNFTKGEGEVAYALNYQIKDINNDGFIDASDALRQYPMGHGDAWGHYLSAMRKRYDLLKAPLFNWSARGEYYNILDVVVGVDFADERNFARTAAARSKVGAEIVGLTFRSKYDAVTDNPLTGYGDTDADRAWGVTEWAHRVGQAALFDWVTANAILPVADPINPAADLQKPTRGTVGEIAEIATSLSAIQSAVDSANGGMNPLGLDPDVLPFDIDPTHIDVGSTAQIGREAVQGLSHFEQIFERAYEAMRNADAAFDAANDQKARLRQVNETADQRRKQAVVQDLEYRNRLIEIFGTPYSGQIGAGKAYPAGYTGPDMNLFMYVDVNAINAQTVPEADPVTYFDEYVSFYEMIADLPASSAVDLNQHFLDDISLGGNTAVELLGDDLIHLKLPATASDYTFVAPESWGQRSAPGQLQTMVGEMLQTQAELSLAVGDYDFLIKQLRDRVALLKLRADLSEQSLLAKTQLLSDIQSLNNKITALQTSADVFTGAADLLAEIADGTIEGMPKVVGFSIDPSFLPRFTVRITAAPIYVGLRATAIGLEAQAGVEERKKDIVQLLAEMQSDLRETTFELRGMLYDIEELLVNEGVQRIRIFSIREQLRGQLDQYRATLQAGIRLMEERRNANIALASDTQEDRYHDMLFRSARHESIQRYRQLYDLAQRYCFMSAKAFDYETNFDPRDPASVTPMLEQIIQARSLGALGDAFPLHGGGLAGIMARLYDNFRAVEGRLGFSNFQLDTTDFSLRREQARIGDDEDWRTHLRASRVDDLWNLPQFTRYCRPFAPRGAPQPGIVLHFATQVRAGFNFFGQPLSAQDAAYDPTMFATKIRAAGISFANYPSDQLARTPYVYLVPAGVDVMTIPNSPTLATREWNVVDQAIPVPFRTSASDLGRPEWIASLSTLGGNFNEIRKFSSFRAGTSEEPELNVTRFIGRSVWNSDWMLIIPGQTLLSNPEQGLNTFIESVSDIKLVFETYGYSGN